MTHKAFDTVLIDPINRTVTKVHYRGEYKHIYELIDAKCYDCARINKHGDGLFVDDEGLFKEEQAFFLHADYPQPLAGKALLLGCDMEDGETVAPHDTLEDTIAKVQWVRPASLNGHVIWFDQNGKVVQIP